jgi:hypothetical protein
MQNFNQPICTPSGTPYVSVGNDENLVYLRIEKYKNLAVCFDKHCLPELIKQLKEINDRS